MSSEWDMNDSHWIEFVIISTP